MTHIVVTALTRTLSSVEKTLNLQVEAKVSMPYQDN